RNRLPASFLARVHEVPDAVLDDRTANAAVDVPQLEQFARGAQTRGSQFVGVVAANERVANTGCIDSSAHGVAARLRHDVHRRAADLGLTEATGGRKADLLRVRDIGQISRHAAAAERGADAETIHLQATFRATST